MERESSKKNAQLSFCGRREAFHQEIILPGIQPCFLHHGSLRQTKVTATFTTLSQSFSTIHENYLTITANN